MGADLYIPKLHDPVTKEWRPKFDEAVAARNALPENSAERTAAQKAVDEAMEHLWGEEHYFRDSYNSTSVLWCLGLSWWRDMEYDVKDENSAVNVSEEGCRRFLAKVQAAPFNLPARQVLEKRHAKVEDDGENDIESWHRYYMEKRERLIAFLKRAAENGGMYASC